MAKLEEYKAQGKIRNIGFSFHDDLDAFKLWADFYDWDFVQIQLNYMDVDHQQGMEGYEILTKKNIPVIVMEPVKGGSLVKFNDEIEGLFHDYNKESSIASWAFRYVGSLPNVKVILSGMSTMQQINDAIVLLGDENLILLHCNSTYPAATNELNLNVINTFRELFKCPIGYSGHESITYPSVIAAVLGACVIERHITLDRAMYGTDQAASLELRGLQIMCSEIRNIPIYLGTGNKTVYDSEQPLIQKLRLVK